jgi:hypothetical protein
MVITNTVIPILSIVFAILENVTEKGQRLLSVKYRLWMFDYGFLLVIAQLIIIVFTFFVWKKSRYRLISVAIFLIWLIAWFFISKETSVFD